MSPFQHEWGDAMMNLLDPVRQPGSIILGALMDDY